MAFRYQPLKSGEIRLLKPISRAPAELSFEIVHLSLSSKPHYAALSYTWGLPDSKYGVGLNGEYFPNRQNLHQALQQIQASKLLDQFIWIDAICINQGDDVDALKERSFQITLMKQIYKQAERILVWLGHPVNENNNRLAAAMMRDIEKRSLKIMKKGRPDRPWWWSHKPRTQAEDLAHIISELTPAKN